MTPVIVWFRRDLRLHDHIPLYNAIQTGQPIIPLFIFDSAILDSKRISPARLEFMHNAIHALRDELRAVGGDLHIQYGNPADILSDIVTKTGATALFYGIDYTPYAKKRDEALTQTLNITIHASHDRLLVPPHAIATGEGKPYTVFTPFKNKWRTLEKLNSVEITLLPQHFFNTSHIPQADFLPIPKHAVQIPVATSSEGQNRLTEFMRRAIYHYAENRNALGNPSDNPKTKTSFLSPYIRFGLISTREIYWASRHAYEATPSTEKRDSVGVFVDEIIWHEFYTHILWHFPHVKNGNFNKKFDAMKWDDSQERFLAWCEGRTGYPVVDASMRQLVATGWMHNRARMIVASFLTKDLLIDWRLGEQFFMQHLLDGDTAANNGGWQWSAGTGTDAQPFFRIFNPITQSEKFDPSGDFIRHWLPELATVPDKYIHAPHTMPIPPKGYPAPIIEHDIARKIALEAHAQLKKED
ncbi:MAG: deoxyribodipyrimidine photo-lyase [bacterium]|nr:deoxyribodipyrimidine photo-lyase [bacterium]